MKTILISENKSEKSEEIENQMQIVIQKLDAFHFMAGWLQSYKITIIE